ncbi:MAG: phosphatidate cytidylyltransferase [Simkaniaceae bacterium]|nr:phosphatidate cytidylyltransferase [Simkaniaceae bacterium]
MNRQDILARIPYAIVAIVIVTVCTLFAYTPPMPWVVMVLVACVGVVATQELIRMTDIKGKGDKALLSAMSGLLIATCFCAVRFPSCTSLPFVVFFFFCLLLFLFRFHRVDGSMYAVGQGIFGLLYVSCPLGLMPYILYARDPCCEGCAGRFWFTYLIVVTKMTDMTAYFGGKLFGKRKLVPQVSLGKTVEGGVSGLCGAVMASWLFYCFGSGFQMHHYGLGVGLLAGAASGVIGQIGDLAESLLKRDAGIKDSNSLPGLGGVLDMIDSLLFTTVALYLFLRFSGGGRVVGGWG